MNESLTNLTDYAHIIGVFREQAPAEAAIAALAQAGFEEDKILLTDYHSDQPEDTRILVHVIASERGQEADAILVQYGANNADIPAGTAIANGDLMPL